MATVITSATSWTTIEELCDREFGKQPSPANLAILESLEKERPEVRAFVGRVFRLMAIGRFDPADISPALAWVLAVLMPGLLPGAWGGVIPPWTFEDRHRLIDVYLAENPWRKFGAGTVLLEMGCGFPPQTAIAAARTFPDWRVIGADIRFDPYVLYDAEGCYACLDAKGDVRFFHAGAQNLSAFVALYMDPSETIARFQNLFRRMVERFSAGDDGVSETVEHEGATLTRNPMRLYERPNLTLIEAGIGAELGTADIVRCFNVLFYFDAEFRRQADAWALRTLRPGGLYICGSDAARTQEASYAVYQKEGDRLVPREFAFSIDTVRPLSVQQWFCIHDGERGAWTLAGLIGLLRADEAFRKDFDRCLDGLLAERAILVREADGYFVMPPSPLPPNEWTAAREAIINQLDAKGFVDRAVSVLIKAGYKAWRNPVGHIAVEPRGLERVESRN